MTGAAGIRFGTDGWRAVIADEFSFANVELVGRAVCDYLDLDQPGDKPLLIGYDNRFGAEHFAAHLANVVLEHGRPALLSSQAIPTPVAAFGVQYMQAAGAVMLTASHNPYFYQGFKFIPWFAGPAMPDTTDWITARIHELAPTFVAGKYRTDWRGDTVDLKEAYFEQLDSLLNPNSIASLKLGLLYCALHGTGGGFLDGYLRRCGVECTTLQAGRDVMFGGKLPDPSPSRLADYSTEMEDREASLMVGTDGDADRFGFLDRQGHYFSVNQLLPLLAGYLLDYRKLSGALVRTLCTSHMLDRVAGQHGLPLIETPVGFKYVGDELRRGALIGGEESGGLSLQGHVPEKDGILGALLSLELIATTGEDLHSLLKELFEEFGELRYKRVDMHTVHQPRDILARLAGQFDGRIFLGHKVSAFTDADGLKFSYADSSWIMLRASGTERALRVYCEAPGSKQVEHMLHVASDLVRTSDIV